MALPKRIIHITSSLGRGGAEQILMDVVQAAHTAGYPQEVYYLHGGYHRATLDNRGIPTYPLYTLPFRIWFSRPMLWVGWLWVGNIGAKMAGILSGRPRVVTLHHMPSLEGPLRRALDAWLPLRPTSAIAVSDAVQRAYSTDGWGKHTPWVTIANGVQRPERAHQGWALRQPHEPFQLLTVGRFVPLKGIDRVLKVVAQVHHQQKVPLALTVVGHGPQEGSLRALACKLGIDHLITWAINQDATPWYAQAHGYIQLSDSEGFSLTTAQALMHGLPVLVSGHDHQHPIVHHRVTGLIVDPQDLAQAADYLRTLVTDEHLSRQLAQAGQAHASQHYDVARMQQAYLHHFTRLTNIR